MRPPPILFLHGWTMQGAVFDDLIARLPDFDCQAPDMAGHGSASALPPTLQACVGLIAAKLTMWPGRKPVIVGWSMGAMAAWRYIAAVGSAQIAGLVTIDMSPKLAPDPDWPHGLLNQTAQSIGASTQRFMHDWTGATHGIAATMFASKDDPSGFNKDAARRVIARHDPIKMRQLWNDLLDEDARAIIPDIDVPYLVCSGARSRVYPAAASDWVAEYAPDARRHVFQKSGHSPHLEEPEEFARVLSGFANGLNA